MQKYITSLCLALLLVLAYPLAAQRVQSIHKMKTQLCKKWNYSKCRILGIEYTSNTDEQGDMIHFGDNMTYKMIEGGQVQEGTWSCVPEQDKIQLLNEENEVIKELKIEKLTDSEFIYTVTMNWQYEVSMFMTSEILN